MLPRLGDKSTRRSTTGDQYNESMSSSRSAPSIQNDARPVSKDEEEVDPEPGFQPSAAARLGSKTLDAPRAGFDEYGAELGPDARIWPAYVKEAEAWDEEMVDGWNRSLDVMLIFTALFSAVSTTFVVESLKSLQPDPSQASADALLEITKILRAMSNGTSIAYTEPSSDPSIFSPPTSAIWINALWFSSLALSISVSLVVMLAKQWCYSYMSGRLGQPHVQARLRQRRLEELERWRMPEILAFLPTLIHLSLFLFFVGLIINLWGAHIGVAAPVLATTALTVTFYSLTTILPVAYELCPYNTPLSQFLKASPDNIKWLRTRFKESCISCAKRIANPQGLVENIKFGLWYFFSKEHRHRHRKKYEHAHLSGNPNSDSVMDHLTSRAISWLLTNSQDTRSVDTALQAIAGADHRLPTKPLLDSGAHTLLSQRFRSCFISHPQSGFSFLTNPSSMDVASLYGRALEFFMKDGRHIGVVENVLRQGPGGGFAVRRAYQCLQYDLGRTRPNLAAFGLSGVSTWWSMRSHTGQLPPGTLKEALAMLECHITSESTLHPVALVALVDRISAEAQFWMHKFPPRERALYPITLLRLLSQLDQASLGRARPAIATCLASFAFIFMHLSPGDLIEQHPVGPRSPGLIFLHQYALDDSRTRDAEPLLVYGLLGLLRDHESYALQDADVYAIARQLSLIHKVRPPPTGVSFPFIPSSSNLNSMAVQILSSILLAGSRQTASPNTTAELLHALLPYSYMWDSKSNIIYITIASILRHSQSGPSKLTWDTWLDSEWTAYYVNDMLYLMEHHHTMKHILDLLAKHEIERSGVPYAMRHVLSMLDQIRRFQRRSPRHLINPTHSGGPGECFGAQFLLGTDISMNTAAATRLGYGDLIRTLSDVWIVELEELKDEVPADILNSGVLSLLIGLDILGHMSEKVDDLLRYCTIRVSTPQY